MGSELSQGVPVADLESTLDDVIAFLQANQTAISADILGKINQVVPHLRQNQELVAQVLDISEEKLGQFIDMIVTILSVEAKITQTDLGPRIIKTLQTLRNRPAILAIISRLL